MSDAPQTYGVQDAALIETKALKNGAGAVNSTGADLGELSYLGARLAEFEGRVSAPALTTAQLPDAETQTYKVEHSDDNLTFTTLYDALLVQTGADGAGAGATAKRYKIPTDCKRYVRITATGSTSAGNCSTVSLTHELLF
jgi:hypothetical protein